MIVRAFYVIREGYDKALIGDNGEEVFLASIVVVVALIGSAVVAFLYGLTAFTTALVHGL